MLVAGCAVERDAPRSAVIVILDTTRADHLSVYGYGRETTPHLARLAEEGERYDDAWSPSPWTLPAVASILTGEPPHRHGAGRTAEGLFAIREEVMTLAERLQPQGVRTGAVINVVWCHPNSGLSRGFESYDFKPNDETNRNARDAAATTDAALAWVETVADQPFLLVVHYFDPHLTYDPPQPYDTRFESAAEGRIGSGFGTARQVFALRDGSLALDARQRESLIARYDGEIAWTDAQFGRLRAGLEAFGVWDASLVVVVGDHGEEFWEHGGFEHGHTHHRELLRVPLIVHRPGGAGASVHRERVRLIDIAPTVLDHFGPTMPPKLPGHPLGRGGADHAVAEGSLWGGDLVSIRSDAGTVILDRGSGYAGYFAPEDPSETRPLAIVSPAATEMLRRLEALPPPRRRGAPEWEPDREQLEELRSLGYVR